MRLFFIIFILGLSNSVIGSEFYKVDLENGKYQLLEKGHLDTGERLRCLVIPEELISNGKYASYFGITLGDEAHENFLKISLTSYDKEIYDAEISEVEGKEIKTDYLFNEISNSPLPMVMIGFENFENKLWYFAGQAEDTKGSALESFDGKIHGNQYRVIANGVKVNFKCIKQKI